MLEPYSRLFMVSQSFVIEIVDLAGLYTKLAGLHQNVAGFFRKLAGLSLDFAGLF